MVTIRQDMISLLLQCVDRIADGESQARDRKHAQVIFAVTDTGDLLAAYVQMVSEEAQCVSLRCLRGKDFHIRG